MNLLTTASMDYYHGEVNDFSVKRFFFLFNKLYFLAPRALGPGLIVIDRRQKLLGNPHQKKKNLDKKKNSTT